MHTAAAVRKEYEQRSFVGGMNDSPEAPEGNQLWMVQNGEILPDGTVRVARCRRNLNAATFGGVGQSDLLLIEQVGVNWTAIYGNAAVDDHLMFSYDGGVTWLFVNNGTAGGSLPASGNQYYNWVSLDVAGTTYYFFTNGFSATKIYRINDTTNDFITTPVTFKYLAAHKSRLWAAQTDGKSVYASKIGDPTVWTVPDALVLPVTTNDGEGIRALYSTGNELLIFKRSSVLRVIGSGAADVVTAAGASGFVRGIGTLFGQRTIQPFGASGCIWMSERGVEMYDGIQVRSISVPVRKYIDAIAWSALNQSVDGKIHAVFDPNTDLYWLFTTSGPLVVNIRTGAHSYQNWDVGVDCSMLARPGVPFGAARKEPIMASGGYAQKFDETAPYQVTNSNGSDWGYGGLTMTLKTHRLPGGKRKVRRVRIYASTPNNAGASAQVKARIYGDPTQDSAGNATSQKTGTIKTNGAETKLNFDFSARVRDSAQLEIVASSAVGNPSGAILPKIHGLELWSESLDTGRL